MGFMMKSIAACLAAVLVFGTAYAQSGAKPPSTVTFTGNANAAISSNVAIPPGKAFVWTSGTTPGVTKADAPAGSRERFGDTKTQAASILRNIAGQLEKHGLSMKDVV